MSPWLSLLHYKEKERTTPQIRMLSYNTYVSEKQHQICTLVISSLPSLWSVRSFALETSTASPTVSWESLERGIYDWPPPCMKKHTLLPYSLATTSAWSMRASSSALKLLVFSSTTFQEPPYTCKPLKMFIDCTYALRICFGIWHT